jgi:hypothetical protein
LMKKILFSMRERMKIARNGDILSLSLWGEKHDGNIKKYCLLRGIGLLHFVRNDKGKFLRRWQYFESHYDASNAAISSLRALASAAPISMRFRI